MKERHIVDNNGVLWLRSISVDRLMFAYSYVIVVNTRMTVRLITNKEILLTHLSSPLIYVFNKQSLI
jgi:hypothetical protein